MISLGINPDYYPYPLKKSSPNYYLRDINKYLVRNDYVSENKKSLSLHLQNKVNSLFSQIREYGEGLWEKETYDSGLSVRNNEFWTRKKTTLLLLEQFVLDDYASIGDAYETLPAHKHLIITNHRTSRDPFTIFNKSTFKCFKNIEACKEEENKKFKNYVDNYNKVNVNSLYRFGKYINFWNQFDIDETPNKTTKTEIDYKNENLKIKDLNFYEWIKNQNLFSVNNGHLDQKLATWYSQEAFSEDEINLLKTWHGKPDWKINYLKPTLTHHSSLEEQRFPGSIPMAEGSQKESMLFLYQVAYLLQKFSESKTFEENLKGDHRYENIKSSIKNAAWIGSNLKDRFKNIREYFKSINVVDNNFDPENKKYEQTNSKTFGVITFPPSSFGNGESLIQTISKYPFIYNNIGLKQTIPNGILKQEHDEKSKNIFSVDEHGWSWDLGNINKGKSNLNLFRESLDNAIILTNENDWPLLSDSQAIKSVKFLIKEEKNTPSNGSYDLWNQGLENPLALHLILDNLVDIFQKKYHKLEDNDDAKNKKYKEAMDWGDYWSSHYIKDFVSSSSSLGHENN